MHRPKLRKNHVLHVAETFGSNLEKLAASLLIFKKRLLSWDVKYVSEIRSGSCTVFRTNPHRTTYIHLLNLYIYLRLVRADRLLPPTFAKTSVTAVDSCACD